MARFDRLIPLFGTNGIKKLNESSVAIIGLGGVGGYVALALARSGIGKLIICDFDKVEETNINRQEVAFSSTVSQYKTCVMEKMIKDINPDCCVIKLTKKVDLDIFDYDFDILVDAIDDIDAKVDLIKNCLDRNITLISSMGAAKKVDPTKVKLTRLVKTEYDPVAKVLRHLLKGYDFPCVSSIEAPVCSEMGSYMMVVNTFSILISDYCIKKILNSEE